MKPFYVTTPIYYVNDFPHIGHTYTTVVCDVIARYARLCGRPTYFLTGTDEHGQKIERAAAERGVQPIELADEVVERYHQLWSSIGISHDDFIRTTEPRHRKSVEALIARIADAGDLYVDRHDGWYCTSCETFYTEKELLPGNLCPDHGIPVEWRSEDNVFFRLSSYQDRLLEWYDSSPESVRPQSRLNEVRSFVDAGLRDLSVSRANLDWGIPFPGHDGQTVYVWLDALTNYISALGFARDDDELYRTYWDAEGATRIQMVGKDILRFHAVYWPAFLMSAGVPLPTTVWAHGWWLRDDKKVSKSTGNVAQLDDLIDRFGADGVRYFLLRDMVFGQDSGYSDEALIDRFNSDLANGLGNTMSRVVTLSRRAYDGGTPPEPCDDNPVKETAEAVVREYRDAMDDFAFDKALRSLWRLLDVANQYLVEREPWKLIKSEGPTERLSRILWNGLEATRIVATGLLPFMPEAAPRVLRAVGITEAPGDLEALAWGGTPNAAALPEPEPLFPRIDKEAYFSSPEPQPTSSAVRTEEAEVNETDTEETPMITIEQFFETVLKIGTVQAAERVPETDKLMKLSVDIGEAEPRTLVAGIAAEYEADALVGRQVVVVANLKPAKLRGVESQGMILAASDEGRPILLHPESAVPNGTPVK